MEKRSQSIQITFEIDLESQDEIVDILESLQPFWETEGFPFSVYRDTGRAERLVLHFLTDRSIDDFTRLLKDRTEAKSAFEELRDRDVHMTISVLERVI